MLYRAGRRCPVIEGPRPRLGVADELRDRIHRQRWVHDQDEWRRGDESDRHEVPGHVEGNIRVQAAYRGDGTARHHEGVTIRLRLDNQTDADDAARARPVVNHDLKSQPFAEFGGDDTAEDVRGSGGGGP